MLIHICNNYISSKVHANLIRVIAKISPDLYQWVFIPVRRQSDIGLNKMNVNMVDLLYSKCQGPIIKYFPFLKILVTFISFVWDARKFGFGNNRHILAHTLWSDGCVAYLYSLVTGCSYSVVVRNTDINWFLPKLPHYRWLLRRIVSKAANVIFVSPAHKKRFSESYPDLLELSKSISVVPNGLDTYWIENKITKARRKAPIVTFAGRFDRNKNLLSTIQAVEFARAELPALRLHLVGGSVAELIACTGIKEVPEWVEVKGRISDSQQMKNIYTSTAVMLMPSFRETFGLVYLEAFSQGCAFIHTRNEGIDGYFSGSLFSVAVDPLNIKEIGNAVVSLIMRYPEGVTPEVIANHMASFEWEQIGKSYLNMLCVENPG